MESTENEVGQRSNLYYSTRSDVVGSVQIESVDVGNDQDIHRCCYQGGRGQMCNTLCSAYLDWRRAGRMWYPSVKAFGCDVMELEAICYGLQLGLCRGCDSFVIETDCFHAVNLIYSFGFSCSDMDGVIAKIRDLMDGSSCVGICFSCRSFNELVHCLAKSVLRCKASELWLYVLSFVTISIWCANKARSF